MSPRATHAVSPVDLFSEEVLRDPYPTYAHLRALGPAVWLSHEDVWALPRYAPVWEVQRHPEFFSSVGGPGLVVMPDPMMTGVILSTDPPEHTRIRGVVNEMLGVRPLRAVREDIVARARTLVAEVAEAGRIDAVSDLAARFAVDVVGDLVGLPVQGRDQLLAMADAAFNTFGPFNDRTMQGMPLVMGIFDYIEKRAGRADLAPGTWGATVYGAVDRGLLSEREAVSALSGFIVAGMDTTANGLASAIWLLATHPEQWRRLRKEPGLGLSTFREALRLESPLQAFFRQVTTNVDFDSVAVEAGQRVMMLLGSANRDETRWERADEFDVARDPVGHMAFGGGTHRCGGAVLAEIEGGAILSALASSGVTSLELAGEPVWRLNHVVRGLAQLPVRLG